MDSKLTVREPDLRIRATPDLETFTFCLAELSGSSLRTLLVAMRSGPVRPRTLLDQERVAVEWLDGQSSAGWVKVLSVQQRHCVRLAS